MLTHRKKNQLFLIEDWFFGMFVIANGAKEVSKKAEVRCPSFWCCFRRCESWSKTKKSPFHREERGGCGFFGVSRWS
jgi:hypothetical protein